MKLKFLFLLASLVSLGPAALMMWYVGPEVPWIFYGAEAWAVVAVLLLGFFYFRALRPVEKLAEGMDLLRGGDWNVRLRKVGQPEVDAISGVFNRMLEKLQYQQRQIQEKTHFLTILSDEAPVGIMVTDSDGRIMLCNPCCRRQLGMEDETPASVLKLADMQGSLPHALASMADGVDATVRISARDIKRICRRHFTDCGIRHSFYIIADMTEVVAAAEREGYEKLVRTISHEVNNTAGVIATALDSFAFDDADDAELAGSCRRRVLAMSDFIGAYAGVVKTGLPNAIKSDLGQLIRSLTPFMESMCTSRGCRLAVDIDSVPQPVIIDPAQIQQVIVNVLKNACEASAPGAEVRVACRGGGFTVTNAGTIPDEVAVRIFSPFFTTKPAGQGIGLTLTREVLERHGARFGLASADGSTVFSAHFPTKG